MPTPATQTIILGKASLGNMLKGPCHSGGGQTTSFQGSQKYTVSAQQTGPRTKSFRGKYSAPMFALSGYGKTLNLSR